MALSIEQKKAVVAEVAEVANKALAAVGQFGQVRYRTDKAGIIHTTIGKANFELNALKGNLDALIGDLIKLKPASSKGVYVQKVALSTTMGPGILVDKTTLDF